MTIRVHVAMGGPSAEHDVSLRSGLGVLSHLDKKKYTSRAVVITHQKEFFYWTDNTTLPSMDELKNPAASSHFKGPYSPAASREIWEECDVTFLALHGTFGEDGVFQGFLDTISIPYTGSGVYASAITMNKIPSKFLYIQNGLDVPPYVVYGEGHDFATVEYIEKQLGFPCFAKCPQSGSSRLMGRAADKTELSALLAELKKHASLILVERSISGPEFSCGVIEDQHGQLLALPPIEIRPVKASFFDYEAKYCDGESEEIVPAPRPIELLERIKSVSIAAHTILECSGFSRTDMIYADDKLYVLETNTLPGLTSASLLPKAYAAIGGTYSGLLDLMIQAALKKKRRSSFVNYVLGIDTSSIDLGIGLYRESTAVASYSRFLKNSHAEHIAEAVEIVLKSNAVLPEEITHIAMTSGPGSFTGLRIGFSFIKGFCFCQPVKIFPISSLRVLAHVALPAQGLVYSAIDARRDDIFFASFTIENGKIIRLTGDRLGPAREFCEQLAPDSIIITDTMGYSKSTIFSVFEGQHRVYPVETYPIQRGLIAAAIGASHLEEPEGWVYSIEAMPDYMRSFTPPSQTKGKHF